ncbi:putative porin [Sphaerotilus hippei]|uniref:Putative porin n=1 Tax=Sphaerotilus hippei TaxID=744406 RepID=A0A318H0E9_9BURK|nr:porin [Sphaerotilus hippei]PXW96214.1 putative porin [Sphaerotilus hippei]
MKKSLIALALLGSVAGLAQAQSVTLYGLVDVVAHKDKGAGWKMTSGGVNQSRLGVKGSEDLGGGLKANFLLEHGFNLDTGTTAGSAFWGRQAYVSLSGGFGEVKFGKIWSAYDDISGATNPVFDSVLSPTAVWASTGYNANPNNGVYYASPTFGGVSAAVSTNAPEGVSGARSSAAHVKYDGGPIYAGVAYQRDGDTKFARLNASYDFGSVKLLAGYGHVKAADETKTNEWTLGANVPVTAAVTVSAGYASSKTEGAERATGVSLGATYALSKRTFVYGGYLDTKNAGPDRRYGAGLQHAF